MDKHFYKSKMHFKCLASKVKCWEISEVSQTIDASNNSCVLLKLTTGKCDTWS